MYSNPKHVFTMSRPIFDSYREHAEYVINLLKDKYDYTTASEMNRQEFLIDVRCWNEVLNEKWEKNNLEIVGTYNLSDYSITLSLEEK